MLNPVNTFQVAGLIPYYPGAKRHHVSLIPSVTYVKGTVLGEMSAVNEVQTLTITGTPTGGTFTLSGVNPLTNVAFTTGTIAYNAAASAVATAVQTALGTGTVTGGGGALPGTPVTLTFSGTLAALNVPPLTVSITGLTGGTPGGSVAETTRGSPGTGYFRAYASGASDGSQVAKGLLEYDVVVDASNNITYGGQTGGSMFGMTWLSVPMFFQGAFRTEELTGLDATAVGNLGRLLSGSVTFGLLRMP